MTTAEPITLIADLFPGVVIDTETGSRAEGIPRAAKLHVIISTTTIAVGWEAGVVNGVAQIGTLMIDITGEDISGLDHNGGTIGHFEIKRAGGCSCGAALKRWNPWPGQPLAQLARPSRSSTYGLPQSYKRR